MGSMASQITSLTIVYSAVYLGADQRKHQSSASLAFVWGIHQGLVNSPHIWPITRKMFPFDDVIMIDWEVNAYPSSTETSPGKEEPAVFLRQICFYITTSIITLFGNNYGDSGWIQLAVSAVYHCTLYKNLWQTERLLYCRRLPTSGCSLCQEAMSMYGFMANPVVSHSSVSILFSKTINITAGLY